MDKFQIATTNSFRASTLKLQPFTLFIAHIDDYSEKFGLIKISGPGCLSFTVELI